MIRTMWTVEVALAQNSYSLTGRAQNFSYYPATWNADVYPKSKRQLQDFWVLLQANNNKFKPSTTYGSKLLLLA